MLRTSIARATAASRIVRPSAATAFRPATVVCSSAAEAKRSASAHAISNPTLADIEKRWENLPLQEQADLWMALRDRMKSPWAELTLQEKKAAYWIAFGAHGPRADGPPGEGWTVFGYTVIGCLVSFALFAGIRMMGNPGPATMTKEYQEASNEFLKNQKSDPLSGVSSEGYKGPGMVQSAPAKK